MSRVKYMSPCSASTKKPAGHVQLQHRDDRGAIEAAAATQRPELTIAVLCSNPGEQGICERQLTYIYVEELFRKKQSFR